MVSSASIGVLNTWRRAKVTESQIFHVWTLRWDILQKRSEMFSTEGFKCYETKAIH
jgi:hypothetical protein